MMIRAAHVPLMPGIFAVAAAVFFTTSCPAHAEQTGPSFSCAKAVTVLDRSICGEPVLGDLDRQLETAFRTALKRNPALKRRLLEDQREWLASRAADCDFPAKGEAADENIQCLATTYSDRIGVLEKLMIAKPANEKPALASRSNP